MTITDKHLALIEEHDALKAKCADMEKSMAEAQVALKAKDDEVATLIAKHAGEIEILKADMVKAQADLKAEADAHGATKAELEKARQALANPAFVDAATVGAANPTPEGGGEATRKMTRKEALDAYYAISADDPRARAKFREEHAEELGSK